MLVHEKIDLLTVGPEYFIIHCISEDCFIKSDFTKKLNEKYKMMDGVKKAIIDKKIKYPSCLVEGRTINLVVKKHYWHKAKMDAIADTLLNMRRITTQFGIKNVALSRVSFEMEGVPWSDVLKAVDNAFCATGVKVVICI